MEFKKYTAFTDNRPVTTSSGTTIINKQTMSQNNIKPQDLRATDLRIGNWIADHNEEKRFFKVEQITYSDKSNVYYIHYNNGCTKCQVKYLDPIPLSEEVLLKAGFKPTKIGFWSNGELEVGYITNDEFTQYEYVSIGFKTEVIDIKHLHQLQNIFYSLTGEELEVSF